MKVPELKAVLSSYGESTTGLKTELILRLSNMIKMEGRDPESAIVETGLALEEESTQLEGNGDQDNDNENDKTAGHGDGSSFTAGHQDEPGFTAGRGVESTQSAALGYRDCFFVCPREHVGNIGKQEFKIY